MKRDTTHDVAEGLALLKKRSPMDAVELKVAGDVLIAYGPAPRREDGIFLAKMKRLGWSHNNDKWVHKLDGKVRGKPPKAQAASPKAPAKDRKGGA